MSLLPKKYMQKSNQKPYIYLQIKPFKDNERDVSYWEKVIESLISLKERKISFAISGNTQDIKFYVKIPRDFKNFFENTFYSSFLTSDLIEIQNFKTSKEKKWISIETKDNGFKSKTNFDKEGQYMDPMVDLLGVFQTVDRDSTLNLFIDYRFKLEESAWKKTMNLLSSFFKWVRTPNKNKEELAISEEKKKQIYFSFWYSISSEDPFIKEAIEKNLSSVLVTFIEDGKFKLKKDPQWIFCSFAEVINFFHIPTKDTFIKGLDYTLYRKLPYPNNLPSKDTEENTRLLTVLGNTDYRGDKITFGIRQEDKFRHMYIVGKTWTGKSTFISNMIVSDIHTWNGLCVLDPHGELVDNILDSIPSNRINDVILFDISDTEYPIGFNLLQAENEDEKNRIASWVVATFQKLFDNSWGPRLEYILRNVVLTVIDYPNATLMHILRILTDKEFRDEVLLYVKDSVLLKFWNNEFNKWQDKQREEAVWPITNKVWQFLSSRLVRNIFWQPRSRLSMRKAMDEGKIVLVNLSKGKIGEDNANMIGSLLVTKIQIDAMARADTAAHLRRPFYLYIDEFQNFATRSFATILSEARKYKLSLIVANQYTSQLDEEIKNAIFGNVGSIVSFTLWYDDALVMKSQFKELIGVNDLISLPKYTAYTRMMIDGISSDPFSMKTLPPFQAEWWESYIEKIRKQSRQRYAMEREKLEALLNAWSKKRFTPQEKLQEKIEYQRYGIGEDDIKTLQEVEVKQNLDRFSEVIIAGEEADAMIVESEYNNLKFVWFKAPDQFEQETLIQHRVGEKIEITDGKYLTFMVDSYQHKTIKINDKPVIIWIGSEENVKKQLMNMTNNLEYRDVESNPLKYVVNLEKLKQRKIIEENTIKNMANEFSIKDIKLWEKYHGYVKLCYNYGIFVTVNGVEGLLHKHAIAPLENGVDRKKYYNIGDKIEVIAREFRDVDWEKKVVWSQIEE